MPRSVRKTYPGAVHHVTARGNNRGRIFLDDADFQVFGGYLGDAVERFGCVIHAYCLLPNHYHLLLETPAGNLSQIMRSVNGRYAGWFNRRHGHAGYVFGSRFMSTLVEDDEYFLTVVRYPRQRLSLLHRGLPLLCLRLLVDRLLRWVFLRRRAVHGTRLRVGVDVVLAPGWGAALGCR